MGSVRQASPPPMWCPCFDAIKVPVARFERGGLSAARFENCSTIFFRIQKYQLRL